MDGHRLVDEITLSSLEPSLDDDAAESALVDELIQQDRIRGYNRVLRLLEGNRLKVEDRRRFHRARRFTLDLGFVDQTLVHDRHIAWRLLAAGVAALALAAAAAYYGSGWILGAAGAAAGAGLACLAASWYRYYDRQTLRTCVAGLPLLAIDRNRPEPESHRRFMAALDHAIAQAHSSQPSDRGELLAAALREHRRIKEQGALGEAEYEQAKAAILQAH